MRNYQAESMDVTQIQKLIHLFNRSGVSEVELNCAEEGLHLVLRRLKAAERSFQVSDIQDVPSGNGVVHTGKSTSPPNQHHIGAQLVGTFHPWLKPGDKALVAVGDVVQAGQIIGTIEALNVLSEIEATVAGRIATIH